MGHLECADVEHIGSCRSQPVAIKGIWSQCSTLRNSHPECLIQQAEGRQLCSSWVGWFVAYTLRARPWWKQQGSVTREEDTCEKVVMRCGSGEAWSPDRKLVYSGRCDWGEP